MRMIADFDHKTQPGPAGSKQVKKLSPTEMELPQKKFFSGSSVSVA
jgi:hypothetical protein